MTLYLAQPGGDNIAPANNGSGGLLDQLAIALMNAARQPIKSPTVTPTPSSAAPTATPPPNISDSGQPPASAKPYSAATSSQIAAPATSDAPPADVNGPDPAAAAAENLRQAQRARAWLAREIEPILLVVAMVIGALAAIGVTTALLIPRPVLLTGTPQVEIQIGHLDPVLRFRNADRAVLAAPSFDWMLVPSPPRLQGPLIVTGLGNTERTPS